VIDGSGYGSGWGSGDAGYFFGSGNGKGDGDCFNLSEGGGSEFGRGVGGGWEVIT
jgi:hypothetical protein